MKRLSIIIPMYNVAPYVERCIRSLEEQDIPGSDYELICIDDGSPDKCNVIVKELQKEYANIMLIEQENQGVSRARNGGINKACGKYLMFIDPDDYVSNNCLGKVLEASEKLEAEVSFLGFTFLNEDGTVRNRILNENHTGQVYSGTEAYFLARGNGRTDPDRMVAVLFQTDFFNHHNLRYMPDIPYLEDGEFIARILCLADRCIFDGLSFYQRTTRPGSATNSRLFFSERATNGFLLAASNLKRFQQEKNLNERQRKFLNQPIVKFVILALNSSIGWRLNTKLSATIRTLKKLGLKRIRLGGCNRSYLVYGAAYNLSPYLSALVIILYPRADRLFRMVFTK